ncbi:flagellar hook-basal body protein FliE [Candidatus Liberibacter asiaticus]|uniref:flagellar hook-basal body complex protein FliE n=1 Tax=Liberibacter asiaticus TaxID=34021 RepID=UPI0012F4B9FC|nr:flagellar hook-basal body complex protein FliE [Candidatus Liberibacter asiaticus]KAE9515743.1 flagellar hook-basal body protein FliE [Candidatus Liberibacter asiaticus]
MMIEQIQGTNSFISHTDTIGMRYDFTQNSNEEGGSSPISFSALLQDMAKGAIGDMEKAENVSLAALQGKTSMREAVDHIMQAERNLNLSIALRDKILSAVSEVSKMQI